MSAPSPRDHAKVLRRRARWLSKRVEEARAKDFVLTHDVAELEALEWALGVLEQWIDIRPADKDDE